METIKAIMTRRSIRAFQESPVSEAQLKRLLEAAMNAPSAGNGRPWHFVVITDRAKLNELAESVDEGNAMFKQAQAAVLLCLDRAMEGFKGFGEQDCSCAAQNLLLAAHDMGLGTVWVAIINVPPRIAGCRKVLGVPEEMVPFALFPLGVPAEKLEAEVRISRFMKRTLVFEVPQTASEAVVSDFLVERFPYHDRAGWCDRIVAGQVLINERLCFPDSLLRAGDGLSYVPAIRPEPDVDFTVGIVWEDEDLLLVDKSGNLPCHPSGCYFNHSLWAWLKNVRGLNDFTLVNRVDRETSGLVVIAKNLAASQNCGKQFSERKVVKRYKALVESSDFPDELDAAGWMTADAASAIRKKRKFSPGGSPDAPPSQGAEWAETRVRLLKQGAGIALIEVEPQTGRLHQIRATLLAQGYPIVGDKMYGVDETCFLRLCTGSLTEMDHARLRMDRQALHAAGLRFRHPKTGQLVTIELDLPADMQELFNRSM